MTALQPWYRTCSAVIIPLSAFREQGSSETEKCIKDAQKNAAPPEPHFSTEYSALVCQNTIAVY